MHTIWFREHNRLADLIAAADPSLDDEAVFQESLNIEPFISSIARNKNYGCSSGKGVWMTAGLRLDILWIQCIYTVDISTRCPPNICTLSRLQASAGHPDHIC